MRWGWGGDIFRGTRRGMKGKVTIFLRVPVKAGEVSRHDRRRDASRSCAARMRNRGRGIRNEKLRR